MKLTSFLILIACLQVSAKGLSQSVTFSGKDVPLEKVFNEVEKQTGFTFFFDADMLKETKPVTIEANSLVLESFLAAILKDQPLKYSIRNKAIIISRKIGVAASSDRLPSSAADGLAPPFPVSGFVRDSLGKPLARATVTVKGKKSSTSTDDRGHFSLNVSSGDVLLITYVGFQTQEYKITSAVAASSDRQLSILLSPSSSTLNQVVVNKGYYNTTQRLNTGNVTTITAETIEKQPVSNVLAAIEGRVPGMYITQGNGLPGSSFTVQIRGQNSIANGNDPLYVIDGVPYTSSFNNPHIGTPNTQNPAGGNPLSFINPLDIESISILKDADATAIYGSRGANGVVLITTKKGKAGAAKVNLNMSTGIGNVSHFVHFMNTQQYLQMRHEAFANDAATPSLANGDYDLLLWDTTRYTNWQKIFLGGTARYTDVQSSVSGGNANVQYLIGGDYHRETTVVPSTGADQKGAFHINLTSISANQKFKIQFFGNYMLDNDNIVSQDPTSNIYLAPDAPPIHNVDGTLNWAPPTVGAFGSWTNPFAYLNQKYDGITNNLVANTVLNYELLPGLELKVSAGYTNMQMSEVVTTPITSNDPAYWFIGNSLRNTQFTTNDIHSWIIEPQASFQHNLWKGKISALAGTTFHQNYTSGQILNANGFSSDALLEDIQAASSISVSSFTNAQYKYNALFGRLNYNIEDKYLINLTTRRDGSSRFGPVNEFHNFGAVGAGWIFSQENFIHNNLPILSFGKIRASCGTSGNDQIGNYAYLDLYATTRYSYEGVSSILPNGLSNPYLAWEVSRKMEGGLELGFFKDRILVTGSYFRNRSSNQLVSTPLPATTGFSSITSNLPATVQNTGSEWTLHTTNIKSKNFNWSSSFNLTIHHNKLIAYPSLASSTYYETLIIGQPLNIVRAYHSIGVNDTTGLFEFTTGKGIPTYSPQGGVDNTVLINLNPKFYGGVENSLSYHSFQLDFFLYFTKITGINSRYFNSILPDGYGQINQLTTSLARWQKPGDQTLVQRFSQTFGAALAAKSNFRNSDLNYADDSYIRLKNVSLSYQLPGSWLRKAHFGSARIYINAENLFAITHHYYQLDPETGAGTMPLLRLITGGIQFSL